jgi:hypothetical protein
MNRYGRTIYLHPAAVVRENTRAPAGSLVKGVPVQARGGRGMRHEA